jgi:hypothetical protein
VFLCCSHGTSTFSSKWSNAPSDDRIIATADNLAVVHAAFDTPVSLCAGSALELRQKARVIASSREVDGTAYEAGRARGMSMSSFAVRTSKENQIAALTRTDQRT